MSKDIERATKDEWLEWFYCYADFGPSHGDVSDNLKLQFMKDTQRRLPEGYDYWSDGEKITADFDYLEI